MWTGRKEEKLSFPALLVVGSAYLKPVLDGAKEKP